jgi:hypothetical protein
MQQPSLEMHLLVTSQILVATESFVEAFLIPP